MKNTIKYDQTLMSDISDIKDALRLASKLALHLDDISQIERKVHSAENIADLKESFDALRRTSGVKY